MRKQEELLSTALRLFTESGFHGTATSRIAKEAGVATGTLFHYYPTKEALILALYKLLMIRRNDFLLTENRVVGDAQAELKACYFKTLEWAEQYPEEFRFIQMFKHSPYVLLTSSSGHEESDPLKQLFDALLQSGGIAPVPPALLQTLFDHHTEAIIEYLAQTRPKKEERNNLIAYSFGLFLKMIS